jgi:hypothetical protein
MNLFNVYTRRLMQAAPEDGALSGGAGGEPPPTPSEDLRSTLESAFQQHEAPAAPSGEPKAGETPAQTAERVRDERGRFAEGGKVAKTAAEADAQARGEARPPKPADGSPEPQKPEGEARAPLQAPRSWRPGAREHWGALPPDVQQEVMRRESEVARFAQQTAGARQVAETLHQMQQQFAPALQAEGVDIVTATGNLMNMVGRLRFGTPQERASTIVGLIQSYGVDVAALDAALVNSMGGQGGQPQQVPQQQFQDPRVDQLLGALQQREAQQVQRIRDDAVREVQNFGKGKDFFADVREDMADILELAARRGLDMTMEQAYERACRMNPEISRIIAQREAAGAARSGQSPIERAKLASSSVRSTPSNTPMQGASQPGNLRGDIEAAWGATETRGR